MKTILLFGLLLSPQDDKIQRLIEQLGSETLEIRERAGTELKKEGRKVLPEVRRAAETHRDAEVRARARDIVTYLTQPRWRTDVKSALAAAKAEGKPILVFSTPGDPDSYLWLGGHLMRTVTFADEKVVDLINEKFIPVWHNHASHEAPRGDQPKYTPEEMEAYPQGGGGQNVQVFMATAEGKVLAQLQGYWPPEPFLDWGRFVLGLTPENASEKHQGRAAALLKEAKALQTSHPEEVGKRVADSPVLRKIAALGIMRQWHAASTQKAEDPLVRFLENVRAAASVRGFKWG